jgi:uncharacterized membrane protein YphA (DoxX/SURF4 family)
MKILTSICRILVGLLFIFSGVIKSNDPKGTAIKLNEYFDVFAKDVQVEQDSILYSITDNLETNEQSSFSLMPSDSIKTIEIVQSGIRKIYYEDEETQDSFLGSDVYVLANNQIIYEAEYILEDTTEPILFNVNIKTGSKEVLLDKKLQLSLNTKHEIKEILPLYKYVKQESVWVGFYRGLRPYAIHFSIIMCILEIVFGFGILIGWKPKLISWLTLLMILFFTFLTWYSAYFNKVTDCGCFGDFIKLEPWTSFYKDIVLLVLILVIFARRNKIVPLFSKLFGWNAMLVVVISSSVFAIYSNMYLPAWDFLPYKIGNNVKKLMIRPLSARAVDSIETKLLYEKNGKVDTFGIMDYPRTEDWKYVNTINKIIAPAWKSSVHGFEFSTRSEINNENIKDTLLNSRTYTILLVSTHLDKSYEKSWAKIKALVNGLKTQNVHFYAVTATSLDNADAFRTEMQLPFYFNNSDETLLKTVVRSNPGVMLWKEGVVIDKWSCRSIPSIDKIVKIISKKKDK